MSRILGAPVRIGCAAMLAICNFTFGAEGLPRSLTEVELRTRIREAAANIKSISVSYRARYDDDAGKPAGSYVLRTLVMKRPDTLLLISAHGHDALDWRDDPLSTYSYVYRDKVCVFHPVNRMYFCAPLDADAPLPGTLAQEFFLVATGIWLFDERQAPTFGEVPMALVQVTRDERYALAAPKIETIHGRPCHVLSWAHHDKLWIDVDRGCALVARELYDPDSGATVSRYEHTKHTEISPGVWLPGRIHNLQYNYRAGAPAERRRAVIDAEIEVFDMRINSDVTTELAFTPPPGSLRLRDVKRPVQEIPGGEDHLDNVVAWIERHYPRRQRRNSMKSAVVATGTALALVFMLIVTIVRWRRLRRTKQVS